jgi:hypothetical protein
MRMSGDRQEDAEFVYTLKRTFRGRFVREKVFGHCLEQRGRGGSREGGNRTSYRSGPPLYMPPIPPPDPYPLLDSQGGGIIPLELEDELGCPVDPGGRGGGGSDW